MMNFNEFTNAMVKELETKLDKDVDVQPVLKNNTSLTGISIRMSGNINPVVYAESLYEQYLCSNFDIVVSDVISSVTQAPDMTLEDVAHFLKKENVFISLMKKEGNEEMLQDMPHRDFMDLAIYYRVLFENEGGVRGTVILHNNHLLLVDMADENELYEYAFENTKKILPVDCVGMNEMVRNMGYYVPEDMPEMMYVLTNRTKVHGASAMLYPDTIKAVAKRLNAKETVAILPSSIHECLVIKCNADDDVDELTAMVQEVNGSQVAPEEQLSDHVYLFDLKTMKYAD